MDNERTPDGIGTEAEKAKKPGGIPGKYLVRLIVTLTAICSVISLLLASVNAVTKEKIAAHKLEAQKEAVFAVFPDADDCEPYSAEGLENDVYLVLKDGELCGYAVKVLPVGFGGEIEMMVGIDSGGKTTGVSIISLSETPGVGSKVKGDSFLSQFKGKGGDISVGDGVDGISGATISSRAVTEGVRTAHSLGIDLKAIGEERGVPVKNGDVTPAETQPAETEPPATEQTEPAATETETDATTAESEEPFSEKEGDGGNGKVELDATESDDKYAIEVGKDEYSSELNETDEPKVTAEPQPVETDPKPTEPAVSETEPVEPKPTTAAPVTDPQTTEAAPTDPPSTTAPETDAPSDTTGAPDTGDATGPAETDSPSPGGEESL